MKHYAEETVKGTLKSFKGLRGRKSAENGQKIVGLCGKMPKTAKVHKKIPQKQA